MPPIVTFVSPELPKNVYVIMVQRQIVQLLRGDSQVVAYGRLKTKENCKLSSLKVVAVAYERWSLTRGSNYSDLTGKILVFWKSGCSREVVAHERCSQGEDQL